MHAPPPLSLHTCMPPPLPPHACMPDHSPFPPMPSPSPRLCSCPHLSHLFCLLCCVPLCLQASCKDPNCFIRCVHTRACQPLTHARGLLPTSRHPHAMCMCMPALTHVACCRPAATHMSCACVCQHSLTWPAADQPPPTCCVGGLGLGRLLGCGLCWGLPVSCTAYCQIVLPPQTAANLPHHPSTPLWVQSPKPQPPAFQLAP